MKKLLSYIFLIVLFSAFLHAQPEKNLDIFFLLADRVYSDLKQDMPAIVKVEQENPENYRIISNRFLFDISKDGKQVSDSSENIFQLLIQKAEVSYEYTDGINIIGGYDLERKVLLEGNYMIRENGKITSLDEFSKTYTDTVGYEMVETLETSGLAFTHSEMPSGSFFSSLLEPVIAVAAIVTTIYLLFTVRSN